MPALTLALLLAGVGLDARLELQPGHRFSTRFGASTHFEARVGGMPIDGAQWVVTEDLQGRVVWTQSSIPPFSAVRATALLDPRAVLRLAAGRIPLALADADGEPLAAARPVYFVRGPELHLGAWVQVATARATDNWQVAVDAVTGEVLAVQNRVYTAADDARVYAPSPGGLDAGVGATPTVAVKLAWADGGAMVVPNDAGALEGAYLSAYNCCLNEGCAADAGPRVVANYVLFGDGGVGGRDAGPFDFDGGRLVLRSVVCDRLHLASNAAALHPSADFVYLPVDGPAPLSQAEPVYSDPFSEVHAFFHANRMHSWLVGLSAGAPGVGTGFRLRTSPAPMLVQTNFVQADFLSDTSAGCLLVGFCNFTRFAAQGNAMFVPRENYAGVKLPELYPDADALFFFQGPRLDFAYDATVVRHEFGHAAIAATAGIRFGQPVVARTWANDEGGALHEGLADFLAAAYADDPEIGRYLGPNRDRTVDGPLRTVANAERCPESLQGTVHEDGRIFSGALWEGRELFRAGGSGAQFDAAVYAALVALAPDADFERSARTVATAVGLAFPAQPDARAMMEAVFARRGATGCSHVVGVDGGEATLDAYGFTTPPLEPTASPLPGPFQLRFDAPDVGGVEVHTQTGGLGVRVYARRGAPVEFVPGDGGRKVVTDAEASLTAQGAGLSLGCATGAPVFVAFANSGGYPLLMHATTVKVLPAAPCPVRVPALDSALPAAPKGCGCTSGLGPFAAWVLLLLARRSRVRR